MELGFSGRRPLIRQQWRKKQTFKNRRSGPIADTEASGSPACSTLLQMRVARLSLALRQQPVIRF